MNGKFTVTSTDGVTATADGPENKESDTVGDKYWVTGDKVIKMLFREWA